MSIAELAIVTMNTALFNKNMEAGALNAHIP